MNDYKETLFLPATGFPMQAMLRELEPEIQFFWKDNQIYEALLKQNQDKPARIIFDGPPYANGSIHLGTALNKILKDIFVRYFFQKQFYSEFIFGWDMFGLPIENKVAENLKFNIQSDIIDDQERAKYVMWLRKACRAFSNNSLQNQQQEFRRLGLLAGFYSKHYKTSSNWYADQLLDVYENLRNKNLILRAEYPTWWSFKKQTSIADSDITYRNIKVQDALFKYEIINSNLYFDINEPIHFLVWTSSVWTIPGNFMLVINENLEYCVVKILEQLYIVAKKRIPYLQKKLSIPKIPIIELIKDNKLLLLFSYSDQFRNSISHVFFSPHVTDREGTGIVHISPAHGRDDYLLAHKLKIQYHKVVDKKGKMVNSMFYDNLKFHKAIPMILERMQLWKMLVSSQWIEHDYPFYKQDLEPLFTIPTMQYFLSFKENKEHLKKLISRTHFFPESTRQKLSQTIESRSEWCISRQRFWGIPIPEIFFEECTVKDRDKIVKLGLNTFQQKQSSTGKSDHRIMSSLKTLHQTIKVLKQNSLFNQWYSKNAKVFLTQNQFINIRNQNLEVTFESSVLDVWFDSSCALHIVKKFYQRLNIHIDDFILIEGVDQHRGWFNSSYIMLNALGYRKSPKKIITHGFVTDNENVKMSKSVGNVINPTSFIDKYGADILRLFFANNKYVNNIGVSKRNIDFAVANYRKIRNVLKWLLGICNSYQFQANYLSEILNSEKIVVSEQLLTGYNFIILDKLADVVHNYQRDMNNFKLWKASRHIENFLINDFSANFAVHAKDIIYIKPVSNFDHKQIMDVIVLILIVLIKLLAPIIPHTCEQSFQYFVGEVAKVQKNKLKLKKSIFLYPTISKLELKKYSEKHSQLITFYTLIVPLISTIINNAKLFVNKYKLQAQKFNKIENVVFWFIPQIQFAKSITVELLKTFFSFSKIQHISEIADFPKNTKLIYSTVNDPASQKMVSKYFSYLALSFTTGNKCQRCWKYFGYEMFNFELFICNSCFEIVKNISESVS